MVLQVASVAFDHKEEVFVERRQMDGSPKFAENRNTIRRCKVSSPSLARHCGVLFHGYPDRDGPHGRQ